MAAKGAKGLALSALGEPGRIRTTRLDEFGGGREIFSLTASGDGPGIGRRLGFPHSVTHQCVVLCRDGIIEGAAAHQRNPMSSDSISLSNDNGERLAVEARERLLRWAMLTQTRQYLGMLPDQPIGDGWHDYADYLGRSRVRTVGGLIHGDGAPAVVFEAGGYAKFENGLLHCDDGPAHVQGHLVQYFRRGLLHRVGGPAKTNEREESWYVDGKMERLDGPAYVLTHRDGSRTSAWYVGGERHREDGPAFVNYDGTEIYYLHGKMHREGGWSSRSPDGTLRWHQNGKPHNPDGPAVVRPGGEKEHWLNGERVYPPFVCNWRSMATFLAEGFAEDFGKELRSKARYCFVRMQTTLSDDMDEAAATGWTPPMARRVADLCGFDAGDGRDGARIAARAMGLAGLVASGRFAELPRGDRELLSHMMGEDRPIDIVADPAAGFAKNVSGEAARAMIARRIAETPARAVARTPGGVVFAFDWKPPPQGRIKSPTRVTATGVAPLRRVDADEAPIVARLPVLDGGLLDLRMIDGQYFRPVLTPGSWRPISEEAFSEAAATGAAWRDSPFLAFNGVAKDVALGLSELAPASAKRLAPDPDAERAAAEERVAAAGPLAVINGVVHRPCGEPEIAASMEGQRWSVSWRLPDGLTMRTDQSLSAPVEVAQTCRFLCAGDRFPPIENMAPLPLSAATFLRSVWASAAEGAAANWIDPEFPAFDLDGAGEFDPRRLLSDLGDRMPVVWGGALGYGKSAERAADLVSLSRDAGTSPRRLSEALAAAAASHHGDPSIRSCVLAALLEEARRAIAVPRQVEDDDADLTALSFGM